MYLSLLFFHYTQGSYYYKHRGSFKVPHFLHFYFQVSYLLIFLDMLLFVGSVISIRRHCFSLIVLNHIWLIALHFLSSKITKYQRIVAFSASLIGSSWCLDNFSDFSILLYLQIFQWIWCSISSLCLSLYSVDWLVGWLFCFTAYQPFSGHLTPN